MECSPVGTIENDRQIGGPYSLHIEFGDDGVDICIIRTGNELKIKHSRTHVLATGDFFTVNSREYQFRFRSGAWLECVKGSKISCKQAFFPFLDFSTFCK